MEEWKQLEDYPNYWVSNQGRFCRNDKIVVGWYKQGYKWIQCGKYGQHFPIHRLVALYFIPNPNDYKEIDHINRIRDDNRVENLRWVTRSENCINKGLNKNNRYAEKHISIHYNGYRVQITRNGVRFAKCFQTLEEAIQSRNHFLDTYNQAQNQNPYIPDPSSIPQ